MRLSLLLIALLSASAQASWFGSDKPEYSNWDSAQLRGWLKAHNVAVPSTATSQKDLQALVKENWVATQTWTEQQYENAQQVLSDYKDSAVDSWDESRLRDFLMQQGVVAPSGPRESLVLAAKQQYEALSSSASSYASSLSYGASTAYYGKPTDQFASSVSASASSAYETASNSLSSVVAQSTQTVGRKIDESKDYVYSTWSDSDMRDYLVEKGVLSPSTPPTTRQQLLRHMYNAYAAVTNPIWKAWSDSYMYDWLVSHKIINDGRIPERKHLEKYMQDYYYTPTQKVYDEWSESQTRDWLVQHGIIKTDAQIKREKLQKLISDNYASASDTVWGGWSDSDIRKWLVEHGYVRDEASAAKVKRDELVKLINDKYASTADYTHAKSAAYLTWPDARLRAYLRNHGLDEDKLPTDRPGLMQEVRIRYVQATSRVEALLSRVRETIMSSFETAEDSLGRVLDMLTGHSHNAYQQTKVKSGEAKDAAWQSADDVWEGAKEKGAQASNTISSKGSQATKKVEL